MTGGVGVPGFVGYEVGAPLPTLTQILDGAPLANSPPATLIAVPGSAYHYSGGGYEIAEALMADTLHAPFPEAMDALVLKPAQMTHPSRSRCLPSSRPWQRKVITATEISCPEGGASVPSTPRRDCGPHRQTTPISCS